MYNAWHAIEYAYTEYKELSACCLFLVHVSKFKESVDDLSNQRVQSVLCSLDWMSVVFRDLLKLQCLPCLCLGSCWTHVCILQHVQVDRFLKEEVEPALEAYKDRLQGTLELQLWPLILLHLRRLLLWIAPRISIIQISNECHYQLYNARRSIGHSHRPKRWIEFDRGHMRKSTLSAPTTVDLYWRMHSFDVQPSEVSRSIRRAIRCCLLSPTTPLFFTRSAAPTVRSRSGGASVVQLLTVRQSQLQIPPLPGPSSLQTSFRDPSLL